MFTEDDLFRYFDQIQKIENRMYETYRHLHDQLTHPEYKRIFGQMVKEEKTHDNLIEGLKDLFI
jgi:rubrerythrin